MAKNKMMVLMAESTTSATVAAAIPNASARDSSDDVRPAPTTIRRTTIASEAVSVTTARIPPSAANEMGSECGSKATGVRGPGASGGRSSS